LLFLLSHPDPFKGYNCLIHDTIKKLEDETNIPVDSLAFLCKLLYDGDFSIRLEATIALGKLHIHDSSLPKKLIKVLLGDNAPLARAGAAYATGFLGEHGSVAIDAMIKSLSDNNDRVKIEAINTLKLAGKKSRKIISALKKNLISPSKEVRDAAEEAIDALK